MKQIPITIKSVDTKDRLVKFLNIIHKFHNLTSKEIAILVEFIVEYYAIKKKVTDNELLNKLLFDHTVKRKIGTRLNIKDSVFQNYLTVFRQKGVIKDNALNTSYIPPEEPFEIIIRIL